MKRHKNLYHQICSFDNLLLAYRKACKGKRKQSAVANFELNLEYELLRLEKELKEQYYQPGAYRSFFIFDPKERMISAAPFRDRVVHHALCNIMEPLLERTFIFDSYANRKGKGTHKAIERFQHFAKKYPYVLKCDIRKFFPSIDHAILKQEIRRKIGCKATLALTDIIIDNSNEQEAHIVYFEGDDLFSPHNRRRGLPIGNLTSQFWANVYLNRFDHFIKEELGVPAYVRYVDDFVMFHSDVKQLQDYKERMKEKLSTFRMIVHSDKTHIHSVEKGVPFLGFRVWPHYRVVKKQKAHRYRRFLRKQVRAFEKGALEASSLESGLNSWLGHIQFGKSRRLKERVLSDLVEQQIPVFKSIKGAWRVLA